MRKLLLPFQFQHVWIWEMVTVTVPFYKDHISLTLVISGHTHIYNFARNVDDDYDIIITITFF